MADAGEPAATVPAEAGAEAAPTGDPSGGPVEDESGAVPAVVPVSTAEPVPTVEWLPVVEPAQEVPARRAPGPAPLLFSDTGAARTGDDEPGDDDPREDVSPSSSP